MDHKTRRIPIWIEEIILFFSFFLFCENFIASLYQVLSHFPNSCKTALSLATRLHVAFSFKNNSNYKNIIQKQKKNVTKIMVSDFVDQLTTPEHEACTAVYQIGACTVSLLKKKKNIFLSPRSYQLWIASWLGWDFVLISAPLC